MIQSVTERTMQPQGDGSSGPPVHPWGEKLTNVLLLHQCKQTLAGQARVCKLTILVSTQNSQAVPELKQFLQRQKNVSANNGPFKSNSEASPSFVSRPAP